MCLYGSKQLFLQKKRNFLLKCHFLLIDKTASVLYVLENMLYIRTYDTFIHYMNIKYTWGNMISKHMFVLHNCNFVTYSVFVTN